MAQFKINKMATASTLLAICYIPDAYMSTQASQWPARCPAALPIKAPMQYKLIKKHFWLKGCCFAVFILQFYNFCNNKI
jgi:hypothetical protein